MAAVNVLIVRAPGTNCELETAFAWQLVGARTRIVHIQALLENPEMLNEVQVLNVAGGFCYGDDISAGRIMATELMLGLSDALKSFVDAGRLVLGICNGFQVLVKTGLLPDGNSTATGVTLAFNASGRYEDRWVHIKACSNRCRFAPADEILYVPVAHAEGRIVMDDPSALDALRRGGHIAFQYVDERGQSGDFPINPNGSMGAIAGLTDRTGQVLGLMPHPERHVHFTHHPCWTRLSRDRTPDGLKLFRAAMAGLR
ncbi:MAG: phosphoribosylformylglycinamidine synthase I [Phycisphaerales bacterium]|nr:phosphoribosylformylglycinamidine synthase I [Phycisphaerales bacterium]